MRCSVRCQTRGGKTWSRGLMEAGWWCRLWHGATRRATRRKASGGGGYSEKGVQVGLQAGSTAGGRASGERRRRERNLGHGRWANEYGAVEFDEAWQAPLIDKV